MFSFFLFFFYFISEPRLSFSPSSVVITFETAKLVRAELFYGKEGLEKAVLKGEKNNKHKFILRDLTPGSYYFRLQADTFRSPVYHFSYPSPEKFRFVILPLGMERDREISNFLIASPPDFIIANSSISGEKDGKKFLIPTFTPETSLVSRFQTTFSFGRGEFPKDSSPFSFLFLPLERDSIDFYLYPPGREDGFDIVFLTGGNTFWRTHPVMKNPYESDRPGLIISKDKEYYWQEGKGTVYFIIPDWRESFPLNWRKGSEYLAFAQSGKGFVEIFKEEKRLKVKTYIFSEELGNYLPQDSFLMDKTGEIEKLNISRVGVKEVNSFSARISWETNLSAVSLMEWGTEPKVYSFRYPPLDIAQVFRKEHSFRLFGLSPNKQYYYRVGARRGDRIIWSEEHSFLTLPPKGSEVILSVNFIHPAYGKDISFFPVSPYTYPKRDSGPKFIGLWDKDLSFTISSDESLACRASQHWIKNSQIASWSFPIPSGSYYYEIGSFSNPEFSGRTRIKIEGKTLEKEEGDTTFFGEIEVNDEELNLELGYGDSLIPGYSGISYLNLSSQPRKNKDETVFLLSASPNPFKDKTVIKYHLSSSHRVILEIYDGLGKKLFTLKNRFEGKGYQECVWDGCDLNGSPLPDGIYFINIQTEEESGWRVKVSLFRQ
ncbi:MAG: fibronectin type III domain-containing protein [candidate division WOR-3 bacterium]